MSLYLNTTQLETVGHNTACVRHLLFQTLISHQVIQNDASYVYYIFGGRFTIGKPSLGLQTGGHSHLIGVLFTVLY